MSDELITLRVHKKASAAAAGCKGTKNGGTTVRQSAKIMLKFLTNKLRTQSINENHYKDNEDHDSGTESDDEIETNSVEMAPGMGSATSVVEQQQQQRNCTTSPTDTGCSMESPAPDAHDAHSSEEELEVINNTTEERAVRPLRSTSSSLPEKRKWSQRGDLTFAASSSSTLRRYCSPENEENIAHYGNLSPCVRYATHDDAIHVEQHSSDEEVHALLTSMTTPVQFRTSPPLEAVKPDGRHFAANKMRSLSPPSKLMHFEESPRKRSRHTKTLQRPHLDFEKMQQLKARSVTTSWRHRGDQGSELTLFCW